MYHWMRRNSTVLLLMLLIGVGSFLRFYNLGTESIWLDEAASIRCSSADIVSIIHNAGPTQNHPPLYFIILHFWMKLFGSTEVATRSLSTIFGIISLVPMFQVGKILFNKRVGLISCFLLAISSYHVYYSQEVRSYSLLLLLSLLSYLFFIKILKKENYRYYLCYFVANLLLGYTHIYGILIIASQVFFLFLFWSTYRQQRVKLLSVVGTTIIAFIPLVFIVGGSVVNIYESGFWIKEPQLVDILITLKEFTVFKTGITLLFYTFLILAFYGLFTIWRVEGAFYWRRPVESFNNLVWNVRLKSIEEKILLLSWLFFTIIVPFIASKFLTPIYLTRYMIGASPAFYLLVARGMSNINLKRYFYTVLLFIIVLSSLGLQHYYINDVKPQWREVAAHIQANSNDHDVIVFCVDYIQNPFDYYYTGDLKETGVNKSLTTRQIDALLENATCDNDRLWLVLAHGGKYSQVNSCLVERYGNSSIVQTKELLIIILKIFF